jgi:predicted RNA-binding Zn-ribbon protein involved in translation (DUF1610 family)
VSTSPTVDRYVTAQLFPCPRCGRQRGEPCVVVPRKGVSVVGVRRAGSPTRRPHSERLEVMRATQVRPVRLLDADEALAELYSCPRCGRIRGEPCLVVRRLGVRMLVHPERMTAMRVAQAHRQARREAQRLGDWLAEHGHILTDVESEKRRLSDWLAEHGHILTDLEPAQ